MENNEAQDAEKARNLELLPSPVASTSESNPNSNSNSTSDAKQSQDSEPMKKTELSGHVTSGLSSPTSPTSNVVGEVDDELEPGYWKSYKFIGSVIAIVLLGNCLLLGYVLPVNILTFINEDIGPSDNISLVSLIVTLTGGVTLLFVGRISDLVGRRYFLIGAQCFGVVGSIVCATANNINTVIGGTVLVGFANGVQTLYPMFVHEIVPNQYRALAHAILTVGVFPTIGFGPIMARAFVEYTDLGWRWCYWLNVIVGGISVILFFLCYFPPDFDIIQEGGASKWQIVKDADYGGIVLYAGGLILILLGFTWAAGTYEWQSAHVLATLLIGLVSLIAFCIYEAYAPIKQQLLPLHLLKIRTYVVVIIVGTVAQMTYYALNVLWPEMIGILYTSDVIKAGWMSCTTGAGLASGAIVMGPFFKIIGHARWQLAAASVGVTAFTVMMAASTRDTQSLALSGTTLSGAFVGWIELMTHVVCGLVVPPDDIGVAMGFFASMRAVGGSIATSVYVAVYSNKLKINIPKFIIPAVTNAGLPSSSIADLFMAIGNGTSAALQSVPGINSSILTALTVSTQDAYASSFKTVFLCTLAFGGSAIIACFFASDVDRYMTSFVNKTVTHTGKDGVQIEEGR